MFSVLFEVILPNKLINLIELITELYLSSSLFLIVSLIN